MAVILKHVNSAVLIFCVMFGDIALDLPILSTTHTLILSHLFLTSEKLKEVRSLLAATGCKVLQTYRADYVLLL